MPKRSEPYHGTRLTDDEYERAIVRLHEGLPPMPSREQARQVRREELNLAIDHRLGRSFPQERRDALWAVQERLEKKRLRHAARHVLRWIFPRRLARDARSLAGLAVREYAEVLSPDELELFFGAEESKRPMLPIDVEPR